MPIPDLGRRDRAEVEFNRSTQLLVLGSGPGGYTAAFRAADLGMQVILVERWDGSAWSVQPTPNPAWASTSSLRAVACSSSALCSAAGSETGPSGSPAPLAERYS